MTSPRAEGEAAADGSGRRLRAESGTAKGRKLKPERGRRGIVDGGLVDDDDDDGHDIHTGRVQCLSASGSGKPIRVF